MDSAPLALSAPLAAVLLLLAVPAAITAVRGWSGSLTREKRLGLHTPAALVSEDAFILANRVAAPLVAGAAVVAAVCAGLVLFLPVGILGAILIAVLGFGGLFGQMAAGSTMGERAAMTVPRPARKPQGGCCGGGGGCGCGSHSKAADVASGIPDLVADGSA